MSTRQFDWSQETELAVRQQMATTIYFNESGDVVVRQREYFDDGDAIVILTLDNAVKLAHAMLRLVDAEAEVPASTAAPKDPTATQRQRRHRDKHRDSSAQTVTSERDSTDQQPLALKLVASK